MMGDIELGVGDRARCSICLWEFTIGAWADLTPPHPVGKVPCCPGVGRKARGMEGGRPPKIVLPDPKPKHRMMGGC